MITAVVPRDVIVTPSGHPAWSEAIRGNWYEGSRWSPKRSWVWFPLQDAKKDLDRFTRYELCKRSRYLWKNSPLIRGVIERLTNLTIGAGIYPAPMSSNADWNKRAKRVWKQICKQPCVDSRMTMSQYQRIKTRERFGDGEGFTLLTYSMRTGKDGLQGFEADRITTNKTAKQGDGRSDIVTVSQVNAGDFDGLKVDAQGMPVGYYVRGVENPYPSETMVHHFTPFRSGQIRGEPVLSACINTGQDIDDILSLEKDAVKDASSHKDIIKRQVGELDPETLRKMRFGSQAPTTFALPIDDKTRSDYYRIHFGAEPVVLGPGDEYTPYKPDRPGSAWQGFMAFLANSIVLSTGLPPSLVLPVEIGGTDIRRDLELAQRIVETWQVDLAGEWQDIWEYFIEGQIEDGPLVDAPSDWREVRWHFPKSITVDRGRDAQQDRADVGQGLMSKAEYHGRYGDDDDDYEQTVIDEVRRFRLRLFGTPIAQPFETVEEFAKLLSLNPQLLASKGNQSGAEDDKEPEPTPAPKPKLKKQPA